MKRYILIGLLLVSTVLHAAVSTDPRAVTMVSYDQSWLDHEGTLALKNNTAKEIVKVTFQLIYYDMQGNAQDYEDYSKKINIAPGMTRKIKLPAYEEGRLFNYYKSEKCPSGGTTFNVAFKLKSYSSLKSAAAPSVKAPKASSSVRAGDVQPSVANEADAPCVSPVEDDHSGFFSNPDDPLVTLLCVSLLISIVLSLYVLVLAMAINRGRNPALWVILSALVTPFGAIFLLLLAGRSVNSFRSRQPPRGHGESRRSPAEWYAEEQVRKHSKEPE